MTQVEGNHFYQLKHFANDSFFFFFFSQIEDMILNYKLKGRAGPMKNLVSLQSCTRFSCFVFGVNILL